MNATQSLESELKALGILDAFMLSAPFLAEVEHALRPHVHEGTVVPFGFVSSHSFINISSRTRLVGQNLPPDVARSFADGQSTFVALEGNTYVGLLVLPSPCSTEHALLRLREDIDGLVVATDRTGRTRIIASRGIAIHELRRWRVKPSVNDSIASIASLVSVSSPGLLRTLLSFCYHTLSPANTGATLVWFLEMPTAEALARARPKHFIVDFALNLTQQTTWSWAHSILSRTDGATIVSPTGVILGVGAHLSVSKRSESLIPAAPGTRHTSARRYSYDWPETVLFTVSADGPVTVFSDGAAASTLRYVDIEDFFERLRVAGVPRDGKIEINSIEETCSDCGKTSRVVVASSTAHSRTDFVNCPVCNRKLGIPAGFYESSGVVKKLAGKPG